MTEHKHPTLAGQYYTVRSATLVYGSPNRGSVVAYKVPIIRDAILDALVTQQNVHTDAVRAMMKDPASPRTLRNIAWSFPGLRARFSHFPSFAAFDVVAGTNEDHRPLMQMVGMDNDGGNILCAQGLLLDQTIPRQTGRQVDRHLHPSTHLPSCIYPLSYLRT
jgi:hypothetical protein